MFKNLRKKKKGFTLIELIIVIAIIAILAAVAVPKFGDVRKNAALKADVANAKVIADAASALIAEGEIKVTGVLDLVIDKNTNTVITDRTSEDKIEAYLQKVPTPQTAGYTGYKVYISADGNTTVYMVGGAGITSKDLYPEVKDRT